MNGDPYAEALNKALTEVKKGYPNIKHSFIFTKNGTVIAGDPETDEETIKEITESFETLRDKTKVIGNIQSFQVNAKNGKLILSHIKDTYLLLGTSEKAGKTHIHSIIHVIIPTVLKSLETSNPTPIQFTPPKKLVVDTFSGFFAGNTVQIDAETLMEWTKNTNPRARLKTAVKGEQNAEEIINQVQIETFNGKSALCKVKKINDVKRKGKNLIRIPKKLCDALKLKKGELVKVKPAL